MNTKLAAAFLILVIILFIFSDKTDVVRINSSEDLEQLFNEPIENYEIILERGEYYLNPETVIDSTCGNCQDPNRQITATAGLVISGKNIRLSGPSDHSAVIHTNAGYGLYILNCSNFILENVTITGGIRDTSAFASDAALVIKKSSASIRNNLISNNLGDSIQVRKHVSGIMGICCREDSDVKVINNRILGNSWDGIALYRDARAEIKGNIIDGIDKAEGRTILGGRGVAVGATWNARAMISRNYIARYWKGIGVFVDARVTAEFNLIEDMVTWGIALWDAEKGDPAAEIGHNLIYNLGAMGIMLSSSTGDHPGYLIENIIVRTARDSSYDSPDYYGYQCALAEHRVPKDFVISENIFHNNRRASEELPDYDLEEKEFHRLLRVRSNQLEQLRFFKSSSFYQDHIDIFKGDQDGI